MPDRFNKTVLIVDDDRVFLDSLEQFFLQRGYHCKVARDTDSALRIIRDFSLDVVVADVVMPDKDGLQLMQEAKVLEPDLDFIFMTGYSYDYSYVEIITAGAADYITKPFEMMELIARIERLDREKRLVRELRSTNARLKKTVDQVNLMMDDVSQAARARSNLLADISHEIRTPLTGILGFTDILLATDLNMEQGNYARNIRMSGEIILSLINDFLDSAKVEAGKMQLEDIPFDPVDVCYEACDLIRPRLYGKPVELLCRIGDQVPALLSGDPHRFRQVLLNLMSNAAKFTRAGEIELSLDVEKAAAETDRADVRVSVRDTGIGLTPDNREIIFEPFRQSQDSVSREYGGTGLGLFLCKKISEMMGGGIEVDSRPGEGSTFYFLSRMKAAAGGRRSVPVDISDLAGKKALLVIPNENGLEIVSQMMTSFGMETVPAGDCDIARQYLKNRDQGETIDLCIVDGVLTGEVEKGCEFIRQAATTNTLGDRTPVIVLVEPLVNNTRKCEQAGCGAMLTKPVRRERLISEIKTLLSRETAGTGSVAQETDNPGETVDNEKNSPSGLILLAEDNPVNQKLVAAMLEKGGYGVDIVPDGQAAVDRYVSAPDDFSLILMDVQMPEMDGISATRAIRQWDEGRASGHRRIPIIAITAGAVDSERMQYLDAGMDGLLVKPIRRESLMSVIKEWTGG